MYPRRITLLPSILVLIYFFSTSLLCLQHGGHHRTNGNNITVIGTVFCDICSNNTFTKNSYFLTGAKVQVKCSLRTNSTTKEEILLMADRMTDRYGIYRVDIPPVDGLECREGREIESFCQARLVESSSLACDVPGLSTSAEHMAVKFTQSNLCIYNLNALNYRPQKKDSVLCGGFGKKPKKNLVTLGNSNPKHTLNSSLFFWPPFPPFTSWHFPQWPFPFPCPFPPPKLEFPFPFPWSPPPSSFHFPFPFTSSPPPPAFPWPFPPLGSLPPMPFLFPSPPPPPSFSFPFPPFGPIPIPFTPSPPPPSPPPPFFPFPFPPFSPIPFTPQSPSPPPPSPPPSLPPPFFPFPFPPFSPLPFTPQFPSPPPPSPPPPSFSFPFPPFPPGQVLPPGTPSPPMSLPPGFSFTDPRTWFPFPPPTNRPPNGDP